MEIEIDPYDRLGFTDFLEWHQGRARVNISDVKTFSMDSDEDESIQWSGIMDELFSSILKLTNLEELRIIGVQIGELPETIRNLSKLKILTLKKNQLSELPESIGDLTNLEFLDLQENQLKTLPQSITNLRSLETLYLDGNPLHITNQSVLAFLGNFMNTTNMYANNGNSNGNGNGNGNGNRNSNNNNNNDEGIDNNGYLPFTTFISWHNERTTFDISTVKILRIERDEMLITYHTIDELFPSILKLTNLEHLILYNIGLSSLPDNFGELTNLISLNLANNRLTGLPDSIGELTKLKMLSLVNNNLTELPDSIGRLTNLEELYLRDNKLTAFPTSIGGLSKLRELKADYNKLTVLPDSIGNLSRLRELSLHKNKLTSLPTSIGNLSNLRKLMVEDNNLTTLPDSIMNLRNLKKLYIEGNRIHIENRELELFITPISRLFEYNEHANENENENENENNNINNNNINNNNGNANNGNANNGNANNYNANNANANANANIERNTTIYKKSNIPSKCFDPIMVEELNINSSSDMTYFYIATKSGEIKSAKCMDTDSLRHYKSDSSNIFYKCKSSVPTSALFINRDSVEPTAYTLFNFDIRIFLLKTDANRIKVGKKYVLTPAEPIGRIASKSVVDGGSVVGALHCGPEQSGDIVYSIKELVVSSEGGKKGKTVKMGKMGKTKKGGRRIYTKTKKGGKARRIQKKKTRKGGKRTTIENK